LELPFISQFFGHSELDSVSHCQSPRIEVTYMGSHKILFKICSKVLSSGFHVGKTFYTF
jgi:hypothetical protein